MLVAERVVDHVGARPVEAQPVPLQGHVLGPPTRDRPAVGAGPPKRSRTPSKRIRSPRSGSGRRMPSSALLRSRDGPAGPRRAGRSTSFSPPRWQTVIAPRSSSSLPAERNATSSSVLCTAERRAQLVAASAAKRPVAFDRAPSSRPSISLQRLAEPADRVLAAGGTGGAAPDPGRDLGDGPAHPLDRPQCGRSRRRIPASDASTRAMGPPIKSRVPRLPERLGAVRERGADHDYQLSSGPASRPAVRAEAGRGPRLRAGTCALDTITALP